MGEGRDERTPGRCSNIWCEYIYTKLTWSRYDALGMCRLRSSAIQIHESDMSHMVCNGGSHPITPFSKHR